MLSDPIGASLRKRISILEDAHRRFSARTIPIANAVDCKLPHGGLSAGCVHEIKGVNLATAIGFSAILSARAAGTCGNILYIAPDHTLHPPGLLLYGLNLSNMLCLAPLHPQNIAWSVLEALRCSQVSAVIAVSSGLGLTECRRLQLAAESSGATAFLVGHAASEPAASAITRWRICPASGVQRFDEPIWNVDLLYCSGGRPGKWRLQWRDQQLQ